MVCVYTIFDNSFGYVSNILFPNIFLNPNPAPNPNTILCAIMFNPKLAPACTALRGLLMFNPKLAPACPALRGPIMFNPKLAPASPLCVTLNKRVIGLRRRTREREPKTVIKKIV
jgi:hypothetical protein